MTQRFLRDDGITEVEVEYEVESYGEPHADCAGSICDGGGEGPIINVIEAIDLKTGAVVELTTTERERMEQWLVENLDLTPPEFEDDVL